MKMDKSERVDMEIDMSDEEFIFVARQAHDRDITFNDMMNIILANAMEEAQAGILKIED